MSPQLTHGGFRWTHMSPQWTHVSPRGLTHMSPQWTHCESSRGPVDLAIIQEELKSSEISKIDRIRMLKKINVNKKCACVQ